LVGRALYETGNVERAAPLIEEAVKRSPKNPEACYYLGLIRDEHGDTAGGTEAFLRSRELDLELPMPAWSLNRETFERAVRNALAKLDPKLRAFVLEDEVYLCDVPGVEMVVDGVDPRALLLLDGVSSRPEGAIVNARVFVYQRNLERLAGAVELLEPELSAALEREIAAAFVEREREPTGAPSSMN
jgi:hypothetical protein